MSHGFVKSARVTNGKITFRVEDDDFDPDEYIEVSGNASQAGGAFAEIHAIAKPSAANGANDKPYVDVTVDPLSQRPFNDNEDIMVFVQVSYVWVTVLGPGPGPGKTGDEVAPDTWADVKVVSDIKGEPYTP